MNVATFGSFDLPHVGHVALINHCRELAGDGMVIVGVNTDEFINRFKKHFPIMSTDDRVIMMSALKGVDLVVRNIGEEYIEKTIDYIEDNIHAEIDLLVVGSDWHNKDYLSQLHTSWEYLGERNIGICYYQYTPGVSTSEIKKKINASNI